MIVCLNFLPRSPSSRFCRVCGSLEKDHVDPDKWTPPQVDDEYREKRAIETIQLRGSDDDIQGR
jgi:hypothetical protein